MDDEDLLFIGAESRRHMMNSVAPHYPGMARTPPPDEDFLEPNDAAQTSTNSLSARELLVAWQ